MKRLALVVSLIALVAGASYVLAQQSRSGSTTPSHGLSFWPMGGTDGTNNRVVKLDPNGILRVTEEYPESYQTTSQTLVAAGPVFQNVIRNLNSDGWYVAPFAQRSLLVTTAAGNSSAFALKIYMFGSEDNVNYYPIMSPDAFTDDVTADTTAADTLMLWKTEAQATGTFIYPLPATIYPGRYLAFKAIKIPVDGTDADSNTVTVTIVGQGRMD